MKYHNPVLLQATINLLDIQPNHRYIDATIGGGGHTAEILKRGGLVLGIDQDREAIDHCSDIFAKEIEQARLVLVRSNFTHLKEVVKPWQPISGILFDLGVSSHQFDTPERGFSIQSIGPLDMRMDDRIQVTAADIVNTWPEKSIEKILVEFGEISNAKSIARKIIENRPLNTTADLRAYAGKMSRQVFQALRIAVNDELGSVTMALEQAGELIGQNGRIAVISFHSLEDRIVKQIFVEWASKNLGSILTESVIMASDEEVEKNSRSKSAKLRVFKHI